MIISMFLVTAASAVSPQPQEPVEGRFVARRGESVLFTEAVSFDGTALTTELDLPSNGLRFEGVTVYDESLEPTQLEMNVLNAATGSVTQEVSFEFGTDSVTWVAGPQRGTVAIGQPRGVLFNPVFGHTAMILRRAFHDRDVGTVKVLIQNVNVIDAVITFTGENTGTISMAGTEMQFELDASGWLVDARVPLQGLVVTFEQGDQAMSALPANPENVKPEDIEEAAFDATSDGLTLHGVLTTPVAPARTALVIVAGSGPTDRNGNQASGLRTDLYKLLAWRLAEEGYASVRFDKRGLSPDHNFDFSTVVLGDYVNDVVNVCDALLDDPRFDQVVLAGHSEGGVQVLAAAPEIPQLAGLILLATPGRDMIELVREQISRQVDSATLEDFNREFDKYLAGQEYSAPPGLEVLFAPVNQKFTASLADYDPAAMARASRVPLLIMQGSEDPQVAVRDAESLKQSRPDAELVILEGVGHVLKQRPEGVGLAAEYADPMMPVHPRLTTEIVEWLNSLSS